MYARLSKKSNRFFLPVKEKFGLASGVDLVNIAGMAKPDHQQSDEAIADLLEAVTIQYRQQIRNSTADVTATRLEVARKLNLIRQSIRGLMKHRQRGIEQNAAESSKLKAERGKNKS